MTTDSYSLGLHELGDGCHAYLQPDGGWGWSNAGLIVGDGRSLLVDTLFDLRLTAAMLDAMADLTATAPVSSLVNTHANGDHCYGNSEVVAAWPDVEIVASTAAAAFFDSEQTLPELESGHMGIRMLRRALDGFFQ